MKLTKDQRDSLPSSDFGLPKSRRFPLHDKQHVIMAIRFFNEATPNERAELAKNINKKVKEYGIKVNPKGTFGRYIAKESFSLDAKDAVYEASHIGTLAPIVGGIPTPALDDESIDPSIRILAAFAKEEIKKEDVETLESTYIKWNISEYANSIDTDDRLTQEGIENNLISEEAFINWINDAVYTANENGLKRYIANESTGMEYNYDYDRIVGKVLDIAHKSNNRGMLLEAMLRPLTFECTMGCLGSIFKAGEYDAIYELFDYIKGVSKDNYELNKFIAMGFSQVNDKLRKVANPIEKSSNFSEEEKEMICSRVPTIYRALKEDLDHRNGIVDAPLMEMLLKRLIGENKIDGYFFYDDATVFIKYNSENNTEFTRALLVKQDTDNIYRILVGFNNHMTELWNSEEDPIPTMEVSFTKIKTRANDFLKSISIDKNGNISFSLKDNLTFEHYEEIHKVMNVNRETNNIPELKNNLAHVFALISTIEKEYINPTKGNRSTEKSEEYQEMIRLRALLISDFKVNLRYIMTKDKNFKFLEFYENSIVNKDVYTINRNTWKGLKLLFRTILIS